MVSEHFLKLDQKNFDRQMAGSLVQRVVAPGGRNPNSMASKDAR